MDNIKIATVQMNNRIDFSELSQKIITYVQQASQQGAKIICFPELTFSKLNILDVEDEADFCNGDIVTNLSELALKFKISIIAGFVEKNQNYELFNTAVFINSNGKVACFHRKNILNNYESNFLACGTEVKCFDTGFGNAILLIGNDILSYDILKEISKHKPTFIFVLSQIPEHYLYSFKSCLISRVLECSSIFVISTNIGYHEVARMEFAGLSAVMCNPLLLGNEDAQSEDELFLTKLNDNEGIIIMDFKIDEYNKYSETVSSVN